MGVPTRNGVPSGAFSPMLPLVVLIFLIMSISAYKKSRQSHGDANTNQVMSVTSETNQAILSGISIGSAIVNDTNATVFRDVGGKVQHVSPTSAPVVVPENPHLK